jgi:hypothetical protein
VRNTVLATAVAATLALAAPQAFAQAKGSATKAEVQAIEAQMQALAERLNKLEAANTSLQAENSRAQVRGRAPRGRDRLPQGADQGPARGGRVVSNEVSKVKGADWASKIKFKGDLRYRHEMIAQDREVSGSAEDAADRTRHRIRARLGIDAKVTDNSKVVLQLATGGDRPAFLEPDARRQHATRKEIGVDLAYGEYTFMPGGVASLGKHKNPVWRPGQSLFWDGDFNPEGGAGHLRPRHVVRQRLRLVAHEQFNSNPVGENNDSNVFGVQAGLKFPLLGGETRLAANYFDCGACQDNSPLFLNLRQRQHDVPRRHRRREPAAIRLPDPAAVGRDGHDAVRAAVHLLGGLRTEHGVGRRVRHRLRRGVSLGKASNAKTWEAGLSYQSIDKDALFAQFIDSDFGDGTTDSEGWVIKGGYAWVKNVTFNGTYFINTRQKDVGTELDYNRLQLDVNYKF